MSQLQELNGAISAGSLVYTRVFGWKCQSRKFIVCVAGVVSCGAVVVLRRGRPGGCVAVGSDPPPCVHNGVATVV